MGRPSLYTPELIETIAAKLSEGTPMAVICREDGMPTDRTIENWINSKPEVSSAIARAREKGFDAIAADCLKIADDARNDWMDARVAEGDEKAEFARSNGEVIQRSKLRVDTRLKLLAKWDPRRYGDKIDMNLGGSVNITHEKWLDDLK